MYNTLLVSKTDQNTIDYAGQVVEAGISLLHAAERFRDLGQEHFKTLAAEVFRLHADVESFGFGHNGGYFSAPFVQFVGEDGQVTDSGHYDGDVVERRRFLIGVLIEAIYNQFTRLESVILFTPASVVDVTRAEGGTVKVDVTVKND